MLKQCFIAYVAKVYRLYMTLKSYAIIGAILLILVPNVYVYAGGAREDWSEKYDDIPGAPECWVDGYDDGSLCVTIFHM
ncbi:MAG: hypothetical protein ACRD5J_19995 [Nitrososphaeraceae archaeon]